MALGDCVFAVALLVLAMGLWHWHAVKTLKERLDIALADAGFWQAQAEERRQFADNVVCATRPTK
jgi:hypothetical protein